MTTRRTNLNYFVWNFFSRVAMRLGVFCPGVSQRSERALARLGRWLRRRLRGPRSKLESLRNAVGFVSRLPNLASVICDSCARLEGSPSAYGITAQSSTSEKHS